jgi:Ser/Thr protein kinase RdoA (MazF antagonist)
MDDDEEIPLGGGDVTAGVVRVGDTVRRPVQAHTPAVHALLRHLEQAGFDGAPRVLGIDDQGREILSFMPGLVPPRPLAPWAVTDAGLASVGRLLRRYHEAAAGFVPPPGAAWDVPSDPPELPPMTIPAELVGHCDVTPDNVVFHDGPEPEAYALIDFDLARPTSRLMDVMNTLRHWAPLSDPADRDPLLVDADAAARCRVLCDAYGLGARERAELPGLAEARLARSWYLMRDRAETLGGGWARMWDEGVGDRITRAQAWLARERPALERALTQ